MTLEQDTNPLDVQSATDVLNHGGPTDSVTDGGRVW